MTNENDNLIDFIFETGVLASLHRSGLVYLGMGKQSIAEHSFRVTCIGHFLSSFYQEADQKKVILMCLYHDIHETRTGDLNPIQKKYCQTDDKKAQSDIFKNLFVKDNIENILKERDEKVSIESKLAKDADILEWIALLVEQKWNGSRKVDYWISLSLPRLETAIAKEIGKELVEANPDNWWKKILAE
jgi:putative hydrolase of HD superfamily